MIQQIIDTVRRLDDYYSTREGPYGVYAYNKHCVRDFVDVRMEDYGRIIAEFDTREEASAFAKHMTYRVYAVEILKAIRNPTKDMTDAGGDVEINDEYRLGDLAEVVYKIMIDEASA